MASKPITQHADVTVLNVNDDDANRYAVTRMLKFGNFHVIEATNGREALEAVRASQPDVVVLDVNLPDMSGHEVCARIKDDPATRGISVLQLSAISIRAADRVTGLESGADTYLTMPVEPQELLATVRALLRIRRAEDEAKLAATRWRATFDALSEGVALLDDDGNVLQMNHAMQSLIGDGVPEDGPSERVFGRLLDAGKESLAELLAAASHQLLEFGVGDRWLRVVSDPILEDGLTKGRVVTATDLTERRRLEDNLRRHVAILAQNDRRKDEFLAMLAHELRNPLSAIKGALYQLKQNATAHDADWLRTIASRQADQLARLVDDLLDVSRITTGKTNLRLQPLDLRETIVEVERTLRPMIEARPQTLEVKLPDEPLVISGDRARLEQIVSNLLNNASKYSEEGGYITISAEAAKGDVVVRVSDDGIGIDRELLPNIFDLFTQGQQTIDRPAGGLGIGLTVVRTLMEMHGGSVQASSAGPGKGSEFTIRFPRLDAAELAIAAPRTREIKLERQLRLVIAEDNQDVRELMTHMLRGRGHTVTPVDNGLAAVDSVLATQPDVALIDIGLPGIDGYEVARRIRAKNSSVRLIAVSGYGRDEDLRMSREAGFEKHLTKPVGPAELFETLQNDGEARPPATGR